MPGTASTTSRMIPRSARPVYCWARVRPCTESSSAPSATAMRANSGATIERSSQPVRILTETVPGKARADRAHDRGRARQVAQQRRAGAVADELLDRAADVQVEPGGALAREQARGFAEHLGLGAEELEGDRRLARRAAQQAPRLRAAHHEALGRHRLGEGERRAGLARDQPERQVRDAGHRREHQVVLERDAAQRDRMQGGGEAPRIAHGGSQAIRATKKRGGAMRRLTAAERAGLPKFWAG